MRADPDDPSYWPRRPYLYLANLVLMGAAAGIFGFVLGTLFGESTAMEHSARKKQSRLRPVLEEPAYKKLRSDPGQLVVTVTGTVDSEQTKNRLHEKLRFLFGEDEARIMTQAIEVGPGAANEPAPAP